MGSNKQFFEKVFSTKRMERYFALYPDDEAKAIAHYECNLMLSESLYTSLSVMEVTLRNALCRELETMTGREEVCHIPDHTWIAELESVYYRGQSTYYSTS